MTPDVRAVAAHFGIDPHLLHAVCLAEGDLLKAVQCSLPSVTTREKALDVTARSAVHAAMDFIHARGLDEAYVHFWASRWAPVGASNDPTNLNGFWAGNVKRLWLGDVHQSPATPPTDTSGGSGQKA